MGMKITSRPSWRVIFTFLDQHQLPNEGRVCCRYWTPFLSILYIVPSRSLVLTMMLYPPDSSMFLMVLLRCSSIASTIAFVDSKSAKDSNQPPLLRSCTPSWCTCPVNEDVPQHLIISTQVSFAAVSWKLHFGKQLRFHWWDQRDDGFWGSSQCDSYGLFPLSWNAYIHWATMQVFFWSLREPLHCWKNHTLPLKARSEARSVIISLCQALEPFWYLEKSAIQLAFRKMPGYLPRRPHRATRWWASHNTYP